MGLFKKHRILVCGDAMLDTYWHGKANRISPEAPVPVIAYEKRQNHLGGAANVACNLAGLGAEVWLACVVGDDREGEMITDLLKSKGIHNNLVTVDAQRQTTHKIRIMSSQQQLLRLDKEDKHDTSPDLQKSMLASMQECIERHQIEAIVLQDYNKGTLNASIIVNIIALAQANKLPVYVDPKKTNFWDFKGCYLFKPNLREMQDQVAEMTSIELEALNKAAERIKRTLDCHNVVITLSENGIYYQGTEHNGISAAQSGKVVDVSGAGDTVISTLVIATLSGYSLKQSVELSNKAAAIVCSYPGVVPINLEELSKLAETPSNKKP